MESCCFDRYTSLETALKEAGLIVDEIGREGKKTVITVIQSEIWVKNRFLWAGISGAKALKRV
ncbi:hypothetical protein FACS189491_11410 [Spirochaetia bacterium]|nr:hypothetical protein FACS189491_11410 [Spirochaetia bacterium]